MSRRPECGPEPPTTVELLRRIEALEMSARLRLDEITQLQKAIRALQERLKPIERVHSARTP